MSAPIRRLAVVVSTYNRPEFLRLVLEGYRRQDSPDFTLYVADDGSTESTAALIRELQADFPVPIRHVWHEDHGFRKARVHNLALKAVDEPYVLLTDGDCIPPEGLVSTHLRLAREGCMLTGSRILLSRPYSAGLLQRHELPDLQWYNLIGHRLHKRINRTLPLLLPPHLAAPNQKLHGIHGCHLSCWLQDLVTVNGFDEGFEGWGREDSDLVARLFHAGVRRCNLRGSPVLHLWHPEEDRGKVPENDRLLQACLDQRRVRALKGIAELGEEAA